MTQEDSDAEQTKQTEHPSSEVAGQSSKGSIQGGQFPSGPQVPGPARELHDPVSRGPDRQSELLEDHEGPERQSLTGQVIKGEAGYWRLRARVLAIELREPLHDAPDGTGVPGDFVVPLADNTGGTLYAREAFLRMFERVQFIDDMHGGRFPDVLGLPEGGVASGGTIQ